MKQTVVVAEAEAGVYKAPIVHVYDSPGRWVERPDLSRVEFERRQKE